MSAAQPFRVIGIVGLGLMGGSLARALRALPNGPRVIGADRDASALEAALAQGVIDEAAPAEDLAGAADLVVLAAPVSANARLLRELHGRIRADAVTTDLSSVKRPVVDAARELGLAEKFVGSHPLTGDHRRGFESSRTDMFAGARVWLTPLGETPATERLEAFWRALGCRPERIDAASHDALMAWVSHLPQITATALGATLSRSGTARSSLGPGGRDTTRLAGSPADLWADILIANADMLERPIAELERVIRAFADALRERDDATLRALFREAARWMEGT